MQRLRADSRVWATSLVAAAPAGRSARIRLCRGRKLTAPACTVRCSLTASIECKRRACGPESPEPLWLVASGSGFATRVDGMDRAAVKKSPGQQHLVTLNGIGVGERAASARAPGDVGRLRLAQPAYLCRSWRRLRGRDEHRDATCVNRLALVRSPADGEGERSLRR